MNKLSTDQLRQIPTFLSKHRLIFAWLIILGLFSYTLLQTMAISDPSIDETYLSEQRQEIETVSIDIDEDLQEQIESLLETPVDTDPQDLGTQDPFNP